MTLIHRHRERQENEDAAAGGKRYDRGPAFCTRRDTPHDKYWKPLLRHTRATPLLTRGFHSKVVSEMLGHSSIAIALDTYSHVIPGPGEATASATQAPLFEEPLL